MDIQTQSALIAAAVSLVALLINYSITRTQLKSQNNTFEREVNSKFRISAYDLRIKTYPRAFLITKEVGKAYDRPVHEIIEDHKKIKEQLREWRNSEVMLVISDYALIKAHTLENELGKQPDNPRSPFSKIQIHRMWKCRQNFRGALRKDLGLFHEQVDF